MLHYNRQINGTRFCDPLLNCGSERGNILNPGSWKICNLVIFTIKMTENPPPVKIRSLLILHLGFMSGMLIFTLIIVLLVNQKSEGAPVTDFHGEIILGAAFLSLISFLVSRLLYKKKLNTISKFEGDLDGKLDLLSKASILRWAILEFAGLSCIIAYFLSHEFDIFILILGLLVVFYLTRPTAVKIASDLNVREQDILNLK